MCVCIELDLEAGDDAYLDASLRRLPLALSIRRSGMPWSRRTYALISAGGGCACDMFDDDTSELLPDQREDLASVVEALDRVLNGERVLRADWIGDEPSGEALLSAAELATRIRAGEFKQGVAYRVSWRGADG
jgi:hypothetical protein